MNVKRFFVDHYFAENATFAAFDQLFQFVNNTEDVDGSALPHNKATAADAVAVEYKK